MLNNLIKITPFEDTDNKVCVPHICRSHHSYIGHGDERVTYSLSHSLIIKIALTPQACITQMNELRIYEYSRGQYMNLIPIYSVHRYSKCEYQKYCSVFKEGYCSRLQLSIHESAYRKTIYTDLKESYERTYTFLCECKINRGELIGSSNVTPHYIFVDYGRMLPSQLLTF